MGPLLRDPYPSELSYFQKNPHVSGMATEDDRIILNPFSPIDSEAKKSVYKNEEARIFMRNSKNRPQFKLTKEQQKAFKDYGQEQDIRETIAARILAGDESALESTREQKDYVLWLKKEINK